MAVSVFCGVLLARLGYMTAAAVLSVFPGIFLTTMVLLLLLLPAAAAAAAAAVTRCC